MLISHSRPTMRVNIPMVARVLGWLLIIEGIFMLLPAALGLSFGETETATMFGVSAAVTIIVGIVANTFIHPTHSDMGRREGFLLTASVWVVFSAFGMLPFILCPTADMTVTDAFFEAMSGFTTTGATLFPSTDTLSRAVHLWRCLSQWIGGMGIILFTLAVLPMFNTSGGIQMFNAEVTGITHDKIRPRISQTAKGLWIVYISLTVLLFICLWAGPMDWFEAVCHAMATMSTGGYSTAGAGIGQWESNYVLIVMTVFMFLGGVNFALVFRSVTGRPKAVWQNETFRTYCYTIVGATVILIVGIAARGLADDWESLIVKPLFQVVSVITSTGYTLVEFDSWGMLALSLMLLLMFFGGCAGSTSGGAKIDRLLYLVKYLRNELRRCVRPNAVMAVRINRKAVPSELIGKVTAFLAIYVMLICVGGIIMTAFDVPLFDAFFAAFSCVSNTGLDAAITGYGTTFNMIPDAGKWILAALMLIGRLELFTVLVLFTRTFWR